MIVDLITQQDLKKFKEELLYELIKVIEAKELGKKRWLTSSEVKELLNCSSSTLQNFRIRGLIPFTKLGGKIFYSYEDLLRVMEENRQE